MSSLWEDVTPATERRPLPGDTSVDVAIVGAGYTGLWTAYYLALSDPSLRICIIDEERVGYGASGRNGGWCSPRMSGLDTMLVDPRTRGQAAALQAEMYRTVDEIERVVVAESIACEWAKGGAVVVATRPAQVAKLKGAVARRVAAGLGDEAYRWLEPAEADQHVRMSRNFGAAFTPHCAALQPLALVSGLAVAVERHGVVIYEKTAAVRIDAGSVSTVRGTIRADVVLRATEAWTTELPGSHRDLIPLYSLMVATEPLSPLTWDEIGLPERETFADGRHLVIYGQRTGDGRVAFGGRGAPYHYGSAIEPGFDRDETMFAVLRATLVDLFPVLAGVDITHRWGGPLGVSRDWTPTVTFDREARVGWAGAYGGQGVATANLAGRTLTDLILGRDTDLVRHPIVGHRSREWEPEPLRWIGINTGLRIAESVDRTEARGGESKVRSAVLKRLIGL
jgi:glycine/D-amino acid oxidase-like deaminating enzyme